MGNVFTRTKRIIRSNKIGLWIFSGLAVITLSVVGAPKGVLSKPIVQPAPGSDRPPVTAANGGVTFSGALSQTKIVQGSDGVVYLDLAIETPKEEQSTSLHRATDLVVVLDRSGSMAAENKLVYAKEAIKNLVSQLTAGDRFALVAFDSSSSIYQPLIAVSDSAREGINTTVSAMTPGSSTNISAGLEQAKALLSTADSGRVRRVILLSDGQVNTGVVDPAQLARMATGFVSQEVVLSTIGMGLDFNEVLMTSLADHGSGSYTYLESLAGLGTLLAKNLSDSRNTFARTSSLEIKLPSGVRITDAAGYPLTTSAADSSLVSLSTGQLMSGTKRNLILTLNIPAKEIGSAAFEKLALHYTTDAGEQEVRPQGEPLAVSIVGAAYEPDARASVNAPLVQRIWNTNNMGIMNQTLGNFVRSGEKGKAEQSISDYRSSVREAEKKYGIALQSPQVTTQLEQLQDKVQNAFSGSAAQQETRQKSLAKESQYSGLGMQRSN